MSLTNQELLECIVSYLPYRVKCIKMGEVDEDNNPIISTVNSITNNITSTGTVWVDSESEDGKSFCNIIEDVFLILCPLSDLTKPCLEGGGVPIDLFDVYEEGNFEFTYIQTYRLIVDIAKHGITHDVKWLPYGVIQKLYEWHFDIHVLIQQGYAIDINTITK